MPHKHKRKAGNDADLFDLPPNVRAAPLPVGKTPSSAPKAKKRKINHVHGYGTDDTPKAFSRLLAFQKSGKRRNGLDDGAKPKKPSKTPTTPNAKQQADRKKEAAKAAEQAPGPNSEEQVSQTLKIMPGESLAEFRQRVNQALPLSGVSKTGKKVAGGDGHRVTKHERHLKRLQKGWREEEARIRDKEAEAAELAEEENEEMAAMWEDKTVDLPTGKAGKKASKKGKRKMVVGEIEDGDDEWEALRRKRELKELEEKEGRKGGIKGLNDVAMEPPSFKKIPREIFKVKNGARVNVDNVPSAAGSLRKREELGAERQGIIETYRKMMAAKRDGQQV